MRTATHNNVNTLFQGGGEMGRRIREYNWAATSVGAIATWPTCLRISVNILLSSRFPMFIWWGPELIQFYNDAYRPSFGNTGKHPQALGQRAIDCWPEIWPIISPHIRQVLDGGEATWAEDQLVPIYRNGRIEDVYWTYSYSPIIDDDGHAGGILVVCCENTEKIMNYRRLEESEDQLSFAIEAAELGTWDYNPLTEKFTGNHRLKEWFGLRREDEIDLKMALDAVIPQDRERVSAAIRSALDYTSGGFYDTKYTIINRSDKEERIVRAKGRAWFNEDGNAYRFNGILQDITDQEKAHRESEQAENRARTAEENLTKQVAARTGELQRSNEDLLQFAHVISHDLKEPVRKIKIFSGRLACECPQHLSPEGAKYLEKIQASANRMQAMIEGVLSYSAIAASTDPAATIDLVALLREIWDDLELVTQQKAASIQIAELPAVHGVPILIYQLFYNLINNALKFSKLGIPPVIRISAAPAPEAPGFIKLMIEDNGIGFEEQYATKIFDSFIRLHSKDRFEGTGLGLSLVKKIVERHKGDIYATSILGEGARFIFTLPVGK